MGRIRVALAAVAVVTATLIPATAGDARPRLTFFTECVSHETLVPVTRDQAQSYLPEGFSPTVGAAGRSEQVYIRFDGLSCGDPARPELELVFVSISVNAPARYSSEAANEFFLLDIVGSGARLRELTKALCVGGAIEQGEISGSHRIDRESELGTAVATTTVESPGLSATFDGYATGTDTTGGGTVRWLSDHAGEIRHSDFAYGLTYLSVGAGHVLFTTPFRDLPPVAAGGGIVNVWDQMMFVLPPRC